MHMPLRRYPLTQQPQDTSQQIDIFVSAIILLLQPLYFYSSPGMNTSIQNDKQQQRTSLRAQRKAMSKAARTEATQRCNRALYPLIRRKQRIGVYWATGSELALFDFIHTAQIRGAEIYLPYIEQRQRRLWFSPCPLLSAPDRRQQTGQRILNGRPVIPQFAGHKIRAHQLHTLIVPLVGIDLHGMRLGQGGGFYDATLSHSHYPHQPVLIGAGFACQQVEQLTSETHDQRLDAFVSEAGWQWF